MGDVQQRVVQVYREMSVNQPEFAPRRMAELAPGIVAVEDANNECDAYFDVRLWRFRHPEIWENSPLVKRFLLNVLPGLGKMPPVRTIEDMIPFVKQQLVAKEPRLYEHPEFFEF